MPYLQSTRRCERASALNPANTTVCIAPMRAHASMAIGSSQIMGRYTPAGRRSSGGAGA